MVNMYTISRVIDKGNKVLSGYLEEFIHDQTSVLFSEVICIVSHSLCAVKE